MTAKALNQNDRDLIIALTDDYLNIFTVRPEDDKADVLKLDGYVTEGIGDQWNDLCYSQLWVNYVKARVHPEEQEWMLKACCNENLILEMKSKKVFQGKYRVLEEGKVHYYSFKYVKVSAPDEPLRMVFAFRNIDNFEERDRARISELERLKSTLASTDMGTWQLKIKEGCRAQLIPDDKMKDLMGLPRYTSMSYEDICDMLTNNISPKDNQAFENYNVQLQAGLRTEVLYRWEHPTKGERYVRCGGIRVSSNDGYATFNGYHYDVTEQMEKEIRTDHIIKTYARSYDFINYINMDDMSFTSYTTNKITDIPTLKLLDVTDANEAIRIGVDERVSEEFRERVREFSRLDTMNERMELCNVMVIEFKDVNEAWYESSFTVAERNEDGTIKSLLWAVRKIDDQKQIEIRRQKLLEENIAANQAKTKFLQNMSHEIRTPLNAMFGFAQLLGLPEGSWTMEERKMYNSYIFNSYNMLDMLIGDIIDVADSEHGNYNINLSDVIVNNVLKNAMMSVEYRVPGRVKFYYTSDLPDDYVINSDGRRIQQVLINYLTNACKYTTEGEIHLHCSTTENPGKLTFSVTDTGKGVPAEKADVIFNRFTKLNQYVQGSGLGLNICQMVATKLGGEVYLDTSYTGGARFVFVIPNN